MDLMRETRLTTANVLTVNQLSCTAVMFLNDMSKNNLLPPLNIFFPSFPLTVTSSFYSIHPPACVVKSLFTNLNHWHLHLSLQSTVSG